MRTIQTYVLWEILKIFLICLAVTALLMTVGGGVNEGLKRGLPPVIILQMLPYFLPEMLRYIVPGCLLFAVCTVFGRMSSSNEIVALKSAGISPVELVWPVLVMAYFLSFCTFWMYDVCAGWSRPNMHQIVVQSIDDTAYSMLRTQKSFSMKGFSVTVRGTQGRTLLGPIIHVQAKGDKPDINLTAEEAELRTDKLTGVLEVICRNGRLDLGNEGSFVFAEDEFVQRIGDLGNLRNDDNIAAPAAITLAGIPNQITRETQFISTVNNKLQIATDKGDQKSIERLIRERDKHQKRKWRLETEKQRRLSNGVGCFCFACIGIPVAIWLKSADNLTTFFLCFLPILVIYYPLVATGEVLARDGVWVPYPVWIADGVLLLFGVFLLSRIKKN